jgi:hypothetical protein
MNWLKQLLRKPTPLELAAKELHELEHTKLEATAAREWAYHRINYTEQRMAYLKEYLGQETQ